MSTSTPQTKPFAAEVGKVLQLMIHSLYTNKPIFLRELISNASDACDKLRYEALQNSALAEEELQIRVEINKQNNTISVIDNGIGMSREDLVQNLGTVARSGTQRFLESLSTDSNNVNLIGQFGVGFYSAFMVADRVIVYSTKAGSNETYKWESDGQSDYTIAECDENLPRGTKVVLHLKPEESEFLEHYRLHHIIKTYSDHISFPITLDDGQGQADVVNMASALWARPKAEITEEQYNEFYHYVAHSPDTPWLRAHYRAEGAAVEYTCLLYIPSVRPFDLFNPDRKGRVKLYIKKVFISEDTSGLLPAYLRFVRGVIDSEDLPLNISRETLQHSTGVYKIRKSLVKKILGMLKQRAESDAADYRKFWDNFGEVMKEGLCEGALEEKEQLLEVCRFYSSRTENELVSLDQYIDRMAEGQDQIFYLNGDNIDTLRHSPQLEGFMRRNIEVLLLTDHVDDFWVNVINQYKNKELCSITKSGIDLDAICKDSDVAQSQEPTEGPQEVISYFKTILGNKVSDVKASSKLVDSPACLAIAEGAMNIRMEKFLVAQKQLSKNTAKILEINLRHPILVRIATDVAQGETNEQTQRLAHIVFNQACIIAGEDMEDPYQFTKEVNDLITKALAA